MSSTSPTESVFLCHSLPLRRMPKDKVSYIISICAFSRAFWTYQRILNVALHHSCIRCTSRCKRQQLSSVKSQSNSTSMFQKPMRIHVSARGAATTRFVWTNIPGFRFFEPHLHQQQCRRNVRFVEAIFDLVAQNGNNVERAYCKISSFRQSRNKINMLYLFGLRRKDEISLDIFAKTGNIL